MNESKRKGMVAFTIGKYHINTMEIIKLFLINIFMPVSNFDLWSIKGILQRNQRQKLRILR